ncbi:MAG: hypothetical protein QOJ11_678 [Frankiales bacterium]|jgi:Ca2+-binding RTX toxin-like protein|nr:hypothetical protein [Frankiales bacterium]
MTSRPRLRRLLSFVTVFSVVLSLGGQAVSVAASPPDPAAVAGLRTALTGPGGVAAFVNGLGAVGAFAAPVTGLTLVPGAADALGVGDLFSRAVGTVQSAYDVAGSPSELASALSGTHEIAGDPAPTLPFTRRSATWTAASSTSGTVQTLSVGLSVVRTVPTGIRISTTSQPFDFTSAKGSGTADGLKADVTFTAQFSVSYDSATSSAWLAAAPSISASVDAKALDLTKVDAAIGILGVTLAAGSSYHAAASISGSVRDPDGDGRLTVGTTGELGAPGAASGLSTIALAKPGGGSLDGTLVIVPQTSTAIGGLPGATATVVVTDPDLSAGGPTASYPAGALDGVSAFETLTPFDLAQGVSQLAATLGRLQHAAPASPATPVDVQLPLLHGTVADLVPATEALQQFLADHISPSTDPKIPGQPDFASVQDFLNELGATTGPGGAKVYTVSITGAAMDTTVSGHPTLRFTIHVHRGASNQAADPLASILTGDAATATYTDTTVTDTAKDWDALAADPATKALVAGLVGRQVIAGQSTGVIKGLSGHTITLDPSPFGTPAPATLWKGGTPASGSDKPAYVISAGDPKTGNVELGDLLLAKGRLHAANAIRPQATLTAAYDLTLPVALDLEPALTGDACKAVSPGGVACPYTVATGTGGNGPQYVVQELPVRPDRIRLTTGGTLLTATSVVATDVDITAPVGYVPVHIGGTVTACPTGGYDGTCTKDLSPATPTVDLHLTANGDVPLGTLFDEARDTPAAVVTGSVAAHVHAALTFDLPGDKTFFHADGTAGTASVDADAPGSAPVVSGADLSSLAVLDVDPTKSDALFGVVASDLAALATRLEQPLTANGLDTTIPLVGESYGQLMADGERSSGAGVTYAVDAAKNLLALTDPSRTFTAEGYAGRRVVIGSGQFVVAGVDPLDSTTLLLASPPAAAPAAGTAYRIGNELRWGVDAMTALPPKNLDDLVSDLEQRLGHGSTVSFTVDTAATPPTLQLTVDWKRSFTTRSPLSLTLGLPGAPGANLSGQAGTGLVGISATGQVHAALVIPLDAAGVSDPAGALRLDPSSTVSARAAVAATGQRFAAVAGAFAVDLGDTPDPAGTLFSADLSATAKDVADTAPVTLSSWAAHVAAQDVNAGTTPQTCAGAGSTAALALCAVLPLHRHDTGAALDTLVVQLPKAATSLDDALSTAGTVGGSPRLSALPLLAGAISGSTLDFTPLSGGLSSYLDSAKSGLDVATAGGRVPLIGKDLQAGADFLGSVKTGLVDGLHDKLAAFGTYGEMKTKLAAVFTNATLAKVLKGSPDIQGTCTVTISPPPKPGVAPVTTDTKKATIDYAYAVQAYGPDASQGPTAPSPTSATVQNWDVLSSTNHNDVSWGPVPHAGKYRVYRQKAGGSWTFVAETTSTSVSDQGQGDSSGLVSAGSPVFNGPCGDSDPAVDVDSISLGVSFGQGAISSGNGCADAGSDKCLSASLPIDLGLPGLSLHATKDADTGAVADGVTAKIGWNLHLQVTLDKKKGLLLETAGDTANKLQVGAAISLPETLQASLSFLHVNLTNPNPAQNALSAEFEVDLACPDCSAGDTQLTLLDLLGSSPSALFSASLTGNVNVDEKIDTGIDPSLPGLSTEFVFQAGWSAKSPKDIDISKLEFDHVTIDAGTFLGSTIKPIVDDVVSTLKPIEPVLDTITAPIPVLSDLSRLAGGGDVTIVTLAQAFAAGTPYDGSVETVIKVINAVKALDATLKNLSATGGVDLGSFHLLADKVTDTAATPAASDSLIGPVEDAGGNVVVGGQPHSIVDDLNAKQNGLKLNTSATGTGITFPALVHPRQLMNLLVGGDATLAEFDSGALTVGFSFSEAFGPVYAPPPVLIVISGSASVTLHVVAGFDTYGIRTAVESGRPVQILNSLFFKTVDDSGNPLPVVSFKGELAAGAEVSVAFLSVGVEGGIRLTVNFYWNDPDNDGKFRFDEFVAAALRNPICLFNVGGDLSLFLKVFVTIGFSPFSISFDFTLVDIKLLDFSVKPDCTPPPPRLGGVKDGVLYLYAGNLGGDGSSHPRGDALWDANGADETWVVRQSGTSATVQALGISQTFDGVDTVVLDAKGYSGKLKLLLQGKAAGTQFTDKAVVFGGSNDDVIKTGTGPAYIDGGGGNDVITTGDRPDITAAIDPALAAIVAGDGGNDHITVGNQQDTVLGDGQLSYATASVDTTAIGDGSDPDKPVKVTVTAVVPTGITAADNEAPADGGAGNDVLAIGLGGSTVFGGAGDDQMSVAQDSPLADTDHPGFARSLYVDPGTRMYGGTGSDSINGGSGPDVIFTGAPPSAGDEAPDGVGSADPQGPAGRNVVDTGAGNDVVTGSDAPDFVIGHSTPSQHDTVYGMGGSDVLVGGDGTDGLYGGRGDDYLAAQPSNVDTVNSTDAVGTAHYRITPIADTHPGSPKTLVGGGGTDRIFGGDGNSLIYGDHDTFTDGTGTHADTCSGPGSGPGIDQSDAPAEHPVTSGDVANRDAADLIIGGNGVDNVNAGGGDDYAYTNGGDDLVCAGAGDDHVYAGGGADTVFGGTGGDVLQGDADADHLYGNAGNDTVYGNAGADVVEGNDDVDTLFGGEGNDLVLGGTTTAGRPDSGDTLYGDSGLDVLIGDNGTGDGSGAGVVFDLADTGTALGGADHVYGGADADHAYGGLAADFVYGGDGNDHLEGNGGADTVYGEAGADDLIGGSSQTPGLTSAKDASGYPDTGDTLSGGTGDDVVSGDNAVITPTATLAATDPVLKGRGMTVGRHVTLLDLGYAPVAGTSGNDTITGGDQGDALFGQGGSDTVHGDAGDDYVEGGQGADPLFGDAGQDDIVGGSSVAESGSGQATAGQLDAGDTIAGGDDADVVLADNGLVTRDPALAPSGLTTHRSNSDVVGSAAVVTRSIQPYDLGDTPTAGTSGADYVTGDAGSDVVLGQSGNDRILGGADGDYAEGGPGRDWIQGDGGDDDLVGGSSTLLGADSGVTTQGQPDTGDVIFGGTGDDLVTGDNAVVSRAGTVNPLTVRVGSQPTLETPRSLRLLDLSWSNGYLGAPTRPVAGDDQLSGGAGVDVVLGQDGNDQISGGAGDDYAEGNGGHDTLYGDRTLAEAGITVTAPSGGWPGPVPAPDPGDVSGPNGQDDLIGGSSTAVFRDTGDDIHGDGGSDFELGDNGTAVRDIVGSVGALTDRIYAGRYDPAAIPADAAYVRHGVGAASTRFCTTAQATCEPAGASGDDTIYGDDGADFMYGQDGSDTMSGGNGDDDMYGELGDDRMSGDAGNDAMLGDRGGIVDKWQSGANAFTVDMNQVPAIHYEGFLKGSVTRVTDLRHDVTGDTFAATGTAAAMPHDGVAEGGNDRMRGGDGNDALHGGHGDDLVNGDSGGDTVFGDDGADVLWGGKGSADPANPNDRGTKDALVDYVFGGSGATSGPSLDPKTGVLGSDIIDWRPRGSYTPGVGCTAAAWPGTSGASTADPCSWFEMTSMNDANPANDQHHQGIDWIYGGMDRDVLQGDVADNGPNPGDRLLDWNGAYNLYTHCNAAYGGFNDVRQHSPAMQSFLQRWSYSVGAGQSASDVTTNGTSAYDELALVYPGDNQHGSGSAYPSTPGHFDDPNACAG